MILCSISSSDEFQMFFINLLIPVIVLPASIRLEIMILEELQKANQ